MQTCESCGGQTEPIGTWSDPADEIFGCTACGDVFSRNDLVGGPRSRPLVLIPGPFCKSASSVVFVRRGSERHKQFFNFLKDKGHLDWWTNQHPDFLPLVRS
jgi:hypothetical protein